jgi:hypothetical protein
MNEERCSAENGFKITRREILTGGGAALVGLWFRGDIFANAFDNLFGLQDTFPGVTVITGAKKPVYVPVAGSTDPVAHSLAESLFWLDQETEHAKLLLMHLPSPDLDAQRAQVKEFETTFANHLAKVRTATLDRSNLTSFNQTTIGLVRRFFDAKQTLMKAQDDGRMRSLSYPTFFEHVALEGDRFAKRLEGFSRGRVEHDRSEVVNFWSRIMADHADFVAHLLDPKEKALIKTAMKTAETWRDMKGKSKDKVDDTLDTFIGFKKTAQAGVESGKVDSIIHPILADHVLREALKFQDELKRTA